jgi:glycosyltransferase involved in cell wall biosynthesis
LPRLAESVFRQVVLPKTWVIVDTGSTDETPALVRSLTNRANWVVSASVEESVTARGGPIVRAFSHGLNFVVPPTDVVVKLDADITIPSRFFADLLDRFASIKDLGIAGGSLYELEKGKWRQRYGTDNFVRGACRAYRWQCLVEIMPFEERIGWDGLDLAKARIRGWRTTQFPELPFLHHRALGQREHSKVASWYAIGEAAHYMGYRPYYAVLRSLFKARKDVRAAAMIVGFVAAYLSRRQRHPDPQVLSYVRRQQRLRNLPRHGIEALGKSEGGIDTV